MMEFRLPKTTSRVTENTARSVNVRIRRQAEKNVERYCGAGKEAISRRLEELDYEWDFERTFETGASSIGLVGLLLGAIVDRRWLILPAAVTGFLLVHAVQGWCPPLPFLRRRGFRTEAEIEEERDTLRILRGDFKETGDPREALAEVRLSIGPSITGASLKDGKRRGLRIR